MTIKTIRPSGKIRSIIGPVIFSCLIAYFLYHIFQGERGLFSMFRLQQTLQKDEAILADLQKQCETLERQVSLLRPDNLDLDMLEERVRHVLNFARTDEVIIHDQNMKK